jgi:TIGR03009 family protein
MRFSCLTVASALLLGSSLQAQQAPATPAAPVLDPTHNRLDFHLLSWEQQMKNVQSIVAQCTRISVDKTFQQTDIYEGTAKYMKPNLALLEMQNKNKPQVFEKYICTGNFLYVYEPQNKIVRIHDMPTPKPGQVAEDNFLSFLFGMKAEEARRRYEMKLAQEDKWYVYIEILPRFPADKADFAKARLVLNNQSYLPRELWFEQPNGNEVKWDIPKIVNGAALNRTEFTSPSTPSGWQMVRAPKANVGAGNVPPRIVRPNQ